MTGLYPTYSEDSGIHNAHESETVIYNSLVQYSDAQNVGNVSGHEVCLSFAYQKVCCELRALVSVLAL